MARQAGSPYPHLRLLIYYRYNFTIIHLVPLVQSPSHNLQRTLLDCVYSSRQETQAMVQLRFGRRMAKTLRVSEPVLQLAQSHRLSSANVTLMAPV